MVKVELNNIMDVWQLACMTGAGAAVAVGRRRGNRGAETSSAHHC
jgi:hypothetical protein